METTNDPFFQLMLDKIARSKTEQTDSDALTDAGSTVSRRSNMGARSGWSTKQSDHDTKMYFQRIDPNKSGSSVAKLMSDIESFELSNGISKMSMRARNRARLAASKAASEGASEGASEEASKESKSIFSTELEKIERVKNFKDLEVKMSIYITEHGYEVSKAFVEEAKNVFGMQMIKPFFKNGKLVPHPSETVKVDPAAIFQMAGVTVVDSVVVNHFEKNEFVCPHYIVVSMDQRKKSANDYVPEEDSDEYIGPNIKVCNFLPRKPHYQKIKDYAIFDFDPVLFCNSQPQLGGGALPNGVKEVIRSYIKDIFVAIDGLFGNVSDDQFDNNLFKYDSTKYFVFDRLNFETVVATMQSVLMLYATLHDSITDNGRHVVIIELLKSFKTSKEKSLFKYFLSMVCRVQTGQMLPFVKVIEKIMWYVHNHIHGITSCPIAGLLKHFLDVLHGNAESSGFFFDHQIVASARYAIKKDGKFKTDKRTGKTVYSSVIDLSLQPVAENKHVESFIESWNSAIIHNSISISSRSNGKYKTTHSEKIQNLVKANARKNQPIKIPETEFLFVYEQNGEFDGGKISDFVMNSIAYTDFQNQMKTNMLIFEAIEQKIQSLKKDPVSDKVFSPCIEFPAPTLNYGSSVVTSGVSGVAPTKKPKNPKNPKKSRWGDAKTSSSSSSSYAVGPSRDEMQQDPFSSDNEGAAMDEDDRSVQRQGEKSGRRIENTLVKSAKKPKENGVTLNTPKFPIDLKQKVDEGLLQYANTESIDEVEPLKDVKFFPKFMEIWSWIKKSDNDLPEFTQENMQNIWNIYRSHLKENYLVENQTD